MEQKVKNIFNSLDEHGALLGLPRLKGELNKTYKQRLLDVGVNKSSSSYSGLLNGISRELGLSIYDAITIINSTPVTAGYVPMIDVDHATLTLYEDYLTGLVDVTIELYNKNASTYQRTLSDVVTAINASTYFSATLLDSTKAYEESLVLTHQDSSVEIFSEDIPSSNIFYLKHSNIIEGTVSFSDISVFYIRVASPDISLMEPGEYYINYTTGQVSVKSLPSGSGAISYKYIDIPFTLRASTAIIKDVNDPVMQDRFLDQYIAPDGTQHGSLPSSDYIDLVRESMKKKGLYWGK
jgi:hypothetical protein